MITSRSEVRANKADRYFQTLCKHFSKKVPVDHASPLGIVHFPMGTCRIRLDGTTIDFLCEARDVDKLAQVEQIVAGHVTSFKDLRGTTMAWRRDE